jgi:hypothetical protein
LSFFVGVVASIVVGVVANIVANVIAIGRSLCYYTSANQKSRDQRSWEE